MSLYSVTDLKYLDPFWKLWVASCIYPFLSDSFKDDDEQFSPAAASSPHLNSADMASKDVASEDGKVNSDQLMEESDTCFEDANESVMNSTFLSCKESLHSPQSDAEKGTTPTASSVETVQNTENSADGDNKENL